MLGTGRVDQHVLGQSQCTRLQPFLKSRLRVLAEIAGMQSVQGRLEPRAHLTPTGFPAILEESRSGQGFKRIGQDGVAAVASCLELARPELQAFAQLQSPRDIRQSAFADEVSAHARQAPLVKLRKTLVQQFRDDQADHGITEELQALVVRTARTAVRQRLFAECQTHESVGAKICTELHSPLEFRNVVEIVEQRLSSLVLNGQRISISRALDLKTALVDELLVHIIDVHALF